MEKLLEITVPGWLRGTAEDHHVLMPERYSAFGAWKHHWTIRRLL